MVVRAVLEQIGTLLDFLAYVRDEDYSPVALQQLRTLALCPTPFSLYLSETIELTVCSTCENCPLQNQDKEESPIAKYLMLIAFFLAMLTLLFFLFLTQKVWRSWLRKSVLVYQPDPYPDVVPVMIMNPSALMPPVLLPDQKDDDPPVVSSDA